MNDERRPVAASGPELRIEHVAVERIIDLRHVVLREGMAREAAIFDGDHDPTAVHVAAIAGDEVVGCATLHASRWEEQPAWQLRGMAVAASSRNGGVGGRLVRAVLSHVDTVTPGRTVWANARVPAARFYQRLGWQIVSDVFDIPTAGPHVRIVRRGAETP